MESNHGEEQGKRKRPSAVEFPLHKVAKKQPEKQLKKLSAVNGSPSVVEGLEVPIVPQPNPQEPAVGVNLSGKFYSKEELELLVSKRMAEHREAYMAQDEFSVGSYYENNDSPEEACYNNNNNKDNLKLDQELESAYLYGEYHIYRGDHTYHRVACRG